MSSTVWKLLALALVLSLVTETLQAGHGALLPTLDYFEHEDFEPVTPCKTHRPGDPDLTTYDIISSYRFDEFHARNEGVQQIIGSTGFQTAYHLEEYSNMTIESTQAFPKGVPNEFSFECTFRVPERQPPNEWYLFELTDYRYDAQMSVTMNPIYNTIDFSLPKYDGSVQTISFEESEIFDRAWHKVMFGVTQDSVRLWVDCKPVPNMEGLLRPPLDVRGPIDATNGAFSVAQDCRTKSTVPIDVQWMIFSCDAEKPARSNCEDLPGRNTNSFDYNLYPKPPVIPPAPIELTTTRTIDVSSTTWEPATGSFDFASTHKPWLLTTTPRELTLTDDVIEQQCPRQCPAGPPGPPGLPGQPGAAGEPGLPGLIGAPGQIIQDTSIAPAPIKGARGAPGSPGAPGLPGPPGLPGTTTIIREPTGPDVANSTTQKSKEPESPFSGKMTENEVREICMVVVREYITEYVSSLTGPPGARGPPGRHGTPGVQGIPGEQGLRGVPGERGHPGLPGHKGPPGEVGPAGPEGQKGDRGEDGYGREGPQGPEGPPGPEGRCRDGTPGRSGEPGAPGSHGSQGERGPPGNPGVCPDCSAYNAQYAYPLLLAQQQYSNKGPQSYYNNKGPQDYNQKG